MNVVLVKVSVDPSAELGFHEIKYLFAPTSLVMIANKGHLGGLVS